MKDWRSFVAAGVAGLILSVDYSGLSLWIRVGTLFALIVVQHLAINAAREDGYAEGWRDGVGASEQMVMRVLDRKRGVS